MNDIRFTLETLPYGGDYGDGSYGDGSSGGGTFYKLQISGITGKNNSTANSVLTFVSDTMQNDSLRLYTGDVGSALMASIDLGSVVNVLQDSMNTQVSFSDIQQNDKYKG